MKKQLLTLLTITSLLFPIHSCFAGNLLENIKNITLPSSITTIKAAEITDGNERMNRLLILGIRDRDIDMMQTALDNGANANIYTDLNHFDTPLSLAVQNNNLTFVDFLLAHNADPNVLLKTNNKISILMQYPLCSETIKTKLFDAGTKINFLNTENENILFYILATNRNKIDFDYYISKGADINQINVNNENLLIYALKHSLPKTNILQLINLQVDTKIKDSNGKRAIDYAYSYGDMDIIKKLQ